MQISVYVFVFLIVVTKCKCFFIGRFAIFSVHYVFFSNGGHW